MDSKFVVDVYKNNGINGLIVLLLLLVVGIIAFIVWNELKTGKKKDDSADKFKEIEERLNKHLEREVQEDINIMGLTGRVTALEGNEIRIFNQHKTLFEKIDKLDEKIDTRFLKLDEKIDTRFLVINEDIKEILREMKK